MQKGSRFFPSFAVVRDGEKKQKVTNSNKLKALGPRGPALGAAAAGVGTGKGERTGDRPQIFSPEFPYFR